MICCNNNRNLSCTTESNVFFYNDDYMSNKIRKIAKRKANPITSKEEKLLNEFIKFNEVKEKEITLKIL